MRPGTDTPSAHRRGINDADLADRFDSYRADLQSQPLAAHTRRTYAGRVGGYLAWLAECDPSLRRQQGDPFTDTHARDYTIRDYRSHLITDRHAKPASVNLTLAALDHFYRFLGLGPAQVRREDLPQAAPRALSVEETRRLLRAAERGAESGTTGGVRDRPSFVVAWCCGVGVQRSVLPLMSRTSLTARSRTARSWARSPAIPRRSAAGVVRAANWAASAAGSGNRAGRKESNSSQADQMSRRTASATGGGRSVSWARRPPRSGRSPAHSQMGLRVRWCCSRRAGEAGLSWSRRC